MGLCLSHRGTIKLVDQFGVGVDEKVVKWKAEIEENMDTTVSVTIIILIMHNIMCTGMIIILIPQVVANVNTSLVISDSNPWKRVCTAKFLTLHPQLSNQVVTSFQLLHYT